MTDQFLIVTELAGDKVTKEQVQRLCNRYYWAGEYCREEDVLEVACGTGVGAGYLQSICKNYYAGDYSYSILKITKDHYRERIYFQQFDAQALPYKDCSLDIIIIFEALYYIPVPEKFLSECKRVLRSGGKILLTSANKDLYDFSPSLYSFKYYGIVELNELFNSYGFNCEFFGGTPFDKTSIRQKMLRPVKKAAVSLGLIPKTMTGKKLLKRVIFGDLVIMPAEIYFNTLEYEAPIHISSFEPDRRHKVLYCIAVLS